MAANQQSNHAADGVIMLTQDLLISKGTRDIYRHPHDSSLRLKVEKEHKHYSKRRKRFYKKNLSHNELDLKNHSILRPYIKKYIPHSKDTLIETNMGKPFAQNLLL